MAIQNSRDLGKTWEPSPHSPDKPLFPEPVKFLGPVKMGAPHFVDFGKNTEHSPDGKAYLLGMGAEEDEPHPRPCVKPGQSGEPYVPDPECKDPFDHANLSWISADQVYFLNFPSKFISPDGKTLWLCYSANFSSGWNGLDLKFNPSGGRYGLCLHEIKLR